MGWIGWLGRRVAVLFRRRRIESELDDEIRFHVEMETRDLVRSGVPAAEARRRALTTFGGVERVKEDVRDVRGARLLDDLVRDLRVAARSLRGQPVFLIATWLTLGIGIGGNVAMFAVIDRSLYATLPFPETDRLVTGRSTLNDGARLGPMLSGFDLFDLRDQSRSFTSAGAIAPFPRRVTIEGGGEVERADVVEVTPGFFATLGVRPTVGRDFAPAEGEPDGPEVALLSEGYWVQRFGQDPGVVGSVITLAGRPTTIVGVMPNRARFMVDADLWTPVVRGRGMAHSRSAHNFLMVARLAPRVSLRTAQADVTAISQRLEEAYPDSNRGKGVLLTPTRDTLVEPYRGTVRLLLAAVVLLLVVACANVAGLLMARGSTRDAELAVRSVMGAGRGRLTRQLLTESALLALGGGLLGMVAASWGQAAVLAFLSFEQLGSVAPGLSWSTAGFALALSLGTVLLFGVVPSLRLAGTQPATVLRGAGRTSRSHGGVRLRRHLVVAQVVFTVVLLSVAGLLTRSLTELRSVDLGFDARSLLTAELDLPVSEYGPEERIAFYEELYARLSSIPGVSAVAMGSRIPVRDPGNNWGIGLPEGGEAGGGDAFLAHQRTVLPGYFEALGIPILMGRGVEASDREAEPPVIVLGAMTAERLFGQDNPLGRAVRVQGTGDGDRIHQVVGVVGDVAQDDPAAGMPPAMYYAYHQRTPTLIRLGVRAEGATTPVVRAVQEAVRALDAGVPVDGIETMAAILERRTADQRALAVLVASFAVVAVLLAMVGLYGVLSYQVARRLREIGIRMALGASAGSVSGSVVRHGLGLVALGLLLGIPAALVAARFVRSFLFGIGSADPITYLAVAAVLSGVAVAACALPVRRATRVDPVLALRSE